MLKAVDDYASWLQKSSEDEQSARILLEKGGIPNTICFLTQQMGEKLLKAVLVFEGIEFQKMHDLLALENSLRGPHDDIEHIHNDLIMLNRYYITTRYPGNYPTFSLPEAQEAYQAALRVKRFVMGIIPKKEEFYEQP